MDYETSPCESCGTETRHKDMGLVPKTLFFDDEEGDWVKASVCTECAAAAVDPPTEDEINEAEEELIHFLEDHDLISTDDAQHLRGG